MSDLSINAAKDDDNDEDMEERKEAPAAAAASSAAATSAAASSRAPSAASAEAASSNAALASVIADLGGELSDQIKTDLMKLVSVEEAMKLTGCTLIPRSVVGDSVKEETRLLMLKLPAHIPNTLSIDGEAVPFNRERLEYLLQSADGYDPNLLEVREIQSLTNPCRYFVPPWYRTFCVTAKADIKLGDLLCIYAGEMEEEVQHRCSSYVYELPSSLGVSHFDSKEYGEMPDLIVDAAKKGGIGRFMNDNTFRRGEYQSEAAVNVGVTWVYDLIPHLVFYAAKDVKQGEELVSSYGSEFWDVMCRQALRGHSAYFAYIRPYTSSLEKLLKSRGVSLPERPDPVIEHDSLFANKHGAYAPPPEDSDGGDDDDDDGADGEMLDNADIDFTVEKVVGKKFLRDGKLNRTKCYYKLKWVGYADSENTWEPLVNLDTSMELVAEFEAKLAAKGMKVGVEPLDGPQPDEVVQSAALQDLPSDAPNGQHGHGATDGKRKAQQKKNRKPRAQQSHHHHHAATSAAAASTPSAAAAASGAAAAASAASSSSPIDLTAAEDDDGSPSASALAAAVAASRKRRAGDAASSSSRKGKSSSNSSRSQSDKRKSAPSPVAVASSDEDEPVAPEKPRAKRPRSSAVAASAALAASAAASSSSSRRAVVAPSPSSASDSASSSGSVDDSSPRSSSPLRRAAAAAGAKLLAPITKFFTPRAAAASAEQ
jgi:hypothetical protein